MLSFSTPEVLFCTIASLYSNIDGAQIIGNPLELPEAFDVRRGVRRPPRHTSRPQLYYCTLNVHEPLVFVWGS